MQKQQKVGFKNLWKIKEGKLSWTLKPTLEISQKFHLNISFIYFLFGNCFTKMSLLTEKNTRHKTQWKQNMSKANGKIFVEWIKKK